MSTYLRLLAFSFIAFSLSAHAVTRGAALPEHVPGELIVKFRDAASSRAGRLGVQHTLTQRFGANAIQSIHDFKTDASLAVVKLSSEKIAISALDVLQGEPTVVYVEPNYIYHTEVMETTAGTPNDPSFAKQWNMLNTGQADSQGKTGIMGDDINIVPLWQKGMTGSKNVVVAVIDTGIQWDHPDLKDNLYKNPYEYQNGEDDDMNGFADDIHGWNFAKNNSNSSDDNGHGTHCAGVIGAAGNNGVGVTGINWNVSLMPVKFLDANGGGTLEAAINAINYATMMKVNVMSNSWGGGGFSQAMFDAIQAAQQKGILFIAAAGNDGTSNDGPSATYPSSYNLPNIVSVAATDNKDTLASFSNYSPTKVHVAAPGVNILSTYMGSTYKSLSGTSMATPHIAGISALLLSANPSWSADEVKARLIRTSTQVPGLAQKVMAKGRVNATNAFAGRVTN